MDLKNGKRHQKKNEKKKRNKFYIFSLLKIATKHNIWKFNKKDLGQNFNIAII